MYLIKCLIACVGCSNDLQELHQLHRIEEMETHEFVRSPGCKSHTSDGEGRCVRCENALRLDQWAEILFGIDVKCVR